MKYHTYFFSKIRKDVANLSSAAIVICALRVKRHKSHLKLFVVFKKLTHI